MLRIQDLSEPILSFFTKTESCCVNLDEILNNRIHQIAKGLFEFILADLNIKEAFEDYLSEDNRKRFIERIEKRIIAFLNRMPSEYKLQCPLTNFRIVYVSNSPQLVYHIDKISKDFFEYLSKKIEKKVLNTAVDSVDYIITKLHNNLSDDLKDFDENSHTFSSCKTKIFLENALKKVKCLKNYNPTYKAVENLICIKLAKIFLNENNDENAIPYLEKSLHYYREIGNRVEEGIKLAELGLAYYALKKSYKALEFFAKRIENAIELKDKAAEARATINSGHIHFNLGHYDLAENFYLKYLSIGLELEDKIIQSSAYKELGQVSVTKFDYKKSLEYFEMGLRLAEELKNREKIGSFSILIGSLLTKLDKYKDAEQILNQGFEIAVETNDRTNIALAKFVLGEISYQLKQFHKAIKYYQESLTIYQELEEKNLEGSVYGYLGCAFFALGDYQSALHCHEKELEIGTSLEKKFNIGCAKANLGRIALVDPSLKLDALEILTESVNILYANYQSVKSEKDKISLKNHMAPVYRDLALAYSSQGRHREALEIMDQSRATALSDRLTAEGRNFDWKNPAVEEYSPASAAEAAMRSTPLNSPCVLSFIIRRDQVHIYLGVKNPLYAVRDFGKDTIELFSYFDNLYKDSKSIKNARRYKYKIRVNSRKLYNYLIRPFENMIPTADKGHLVIVPDHSMGMIPWDGLMLPDNSSLIDHFAITVSPSISLYFQTQGLENASMPFLGDSTTAMIVADSCKNLPRARIEAEELNKRAKGVHLQGDAVTKEALIGIMEGENNYSFLHFALHLTEDNDYGLKLASTDTTKPEDAILSYKDIRKISFKQPPSLCVLSCCGSGRGQETTEGMIGMPRAFLEAGIPNIVYSLWPMRDSVLADFMELFYKHLAPKEGFTIPSVAHARREAIKEHRKRYEFFDTWGGLSMMGYGPLFRK